MVQDEMYQATTSMWTPDRAAFAQVGGQTARFTDDDFVIDADCEPRDRRLLNQEAWVSRDVLASIAPRPAIRVGKPPY